jgi:hypothetical protein
VFGVRLLDETMVNKHADSKTCYLVTPSHDGIFVTHIKRGLTKKKMGGYTVHELPASLLFHFFTNNASDAVNPCRKFFSPMGPISPLQKNPAKPIGPNCSCTQCAS